MAVVHGVRAVYSSPLLVADRAIGALNLYATEADRSTPIPGPQPHN